MTVLIVVAHPNISSFNHGIVSKCRDILIKNGHRTLVHDLYKDGFDPVLRYSELIGEIIDPVVSSYCEAVKISDGIIVVHPNWWGQPPAILKGWIDRVLRSQVAYKLEKGNEGGKPTPLLKAKTAIIFNTSDTDKEREHILFGDPLQTVWKNCILQYCGVIEFERKIFRVVADSDAALREEWIQQAADLVNKAFPKSRIQAEG